LSLNLAQAFFLQYEPVPTDCSGSLSNAAEVCVTSTAASVGHISESDSELSRSE